MGILSDRGVEHIHHYTPLHYLPFIARSRALLGKPSLQAAGFAPSHLRSMSSKHDVARGFGSYAFLTLDSKPRILGAKLAAGFPHIGIRVPENSIELSEYSLCRFNIAMTRKLRRGNTPGHAESLSNGRYYAAQQVPVARSDPDKEALLDGHLRDSMIEVLIHGDLALPDATLVICYSREDERLATEVLARLGVSWAVRREVPQVVYRRHADYALAVETFVERALADADWRGDGLEFDRV